MTEFKDYYAVLNVRADATTYEIRGAYKSLSLRWHPDRNPGVNTTGIMQELNEAKAILLNPMRREQYNVEYELHKKQKTEQQPKQPYSKEEQTRRNKERYCKLKIRIGKFRTKEPVLFEEYNKQISGKSNAELLNICGNWDSYQRVYMDLVIAELHEKRVYSLDNIYEKIKVKLENGGNEVDSNTISYRWLWYLMWFILSGLLHAVHR
jgi:curved DNA-binding protein CbpA